METDLLAVLWLWEAWLIWPALTGRPLTDFCSLTSPLCMCVCWAPVTQQQSVSPLCVCTCVCVLSVLCSKSRLGPSELDSSASTKFCLILMTSCSQDRKFHPGYCQRKSDEFVIHSRVFLKRNYVLMMLTVTALVITNIRIDRGPHKQFQYYNEDRTNKASSKFLIRPVNVQSEFWNDFVKRNFSLLNC